MKNTLVVGTWEHPIRVAATPARKAHRGMNGKDFDKLLVEVLFSVCDAIFCPMRVKMPVACWQLRFRLDLVPLVVQIAETDLMLRELEPWLNDNSVVRLLTLRALLRQIGRAHV